ncbi:hypothetical protein Rhe02_07320 [Rhizocola hellebori]|uniref:Uncharacterized protein n=1 Tax=Rhizocola hellebori TaxID=1392758 RepID=A0A8J3VDF5_9ACTN|nr:hypothetical protein Rhe02_07320 [Rhizocola hellebori]
MARFSMSSTVREEELGTVTVMGRPPGETVLEMPMPPSISDDGAPLVTLITADPATGHVGAAGAVHCGRLTVSGA